MLDEATSNVDENTDLNIQMKLAELSQNRTIIVISSRISTIITVDHLLVIKAGKIVEQNAPFKLLVNNDEDD